jgi:diguanylate cyclase (GGDEF)-like protein
LRFAGIHPFFANYCLKSRPASVDIRSDNGGVRAVQASYEPWLVATSLLIAGLAAYSALNFAGRVNVLPTPQANWWLCGGALAMGTGIWSMHFVGMLSLRLPIPIAYAIGPTFLSWLIAILVSGIALYLTGYYTPSPRRLVIGGVLMGLGASCMHYVGMAALRMDPVIAYRLPILITSILIAIGGSIAALWVNFELGARHKAHALTLRTASALIMAVTISSMHYIGMAATEFAGDAICITGNGLKSEWLAFIVTLFTLCGLSLALTVSYLDGRMRQRTGQLADSLDRAQSELQFLVAHDALTRLPNRILLVDRIEQAIAQAMRSGLPCAVLFFDVDRFKAINDSLGHAAGDQALLEVGRRATLTLRKGDTVARLAGDEFAIVLPQIAQSANAGQLATRLLNELAEPLSLNDRPVYLSASVGIALYPNDGADAEQLIASADAAMYHAKRNGRSNYQFFAPEMNAFDKQRVEMEAALRAALAQGQFELHYQPKVDVQHGGIDSVEALIRWHHPQRGMVPPMEFIPLAEETGLIVPIGKWVLREACRQCRAWQNNPDMPPLRVAVNLSASQFRDPDLKNTVTEALSDAQLDSRWLELELTESTVMSSAAKAEQVLEALSSLGVHISIDDFGTGYSSFAYLKRFPLHKLKIDRMFVRDLAHNSDDLAIVQAIVSLAHSLRLKVIAEGVETEAQLGVLRNLRCDEYQGYLCSKPVPAAELHRLLSANENKLSFAISA